MFTHLTNTQVIIYALIGSTIGCVAGLIVAAFVIRRFF
jgi:hypothetical protein